MTLQLNHTLIHPDSTKHTSSHSILTCDLCLENFHYANYFLHHPYITVEDDFGHTEQLITCTSCQDHTEQYIQSLTLSNEEVNILLSNQPLKTVALITTLAATLSLLIIYITP